LQSVNDTDVTYSPYFTAGSASFSVQNRKPESVKSILFRSRWYPNVTEKQWSDWHWQLKNKICTYEQLSRMFRLSREEEAVFSQHKETLPFSVTPYYASLIDENDFNHPLRKAMIPRINETVQSPGEAEDPLSEGEQSPLPGLVHRYPDRVLFLVTNVCACYCRYCTRSRIVGKCHQTAGFNRSLWEKSIHYIESHPEVRDVLLSGGDPLLLPDESLEWLLTRLRKIKHLEIIRIGTKAPVVLPQRITESLVSMLKNFHPLWMNIHCTHPDELTPEVKEACAKLADAGIPLGSQTVLLAGINDDKVVLKNLFHGLVQFRVRPYYLYQCDPILGSSHFRTPVSKGVEIIRSMRGFTSGYAIPTYVIDAPGGGGKIPISPDYVQGYGNGALLLKNFEGKTYQYPDCGVM
jgi:lysine 2,3-aminomutase